VCVCVCVFVTDRQIVQFHLEVDRAHHIKLWALLTHQQDVIATFSLEHMALIEPRSLSKYNTKLF